MIDVTDNYKRAAEIAFKAFIKDHQPCTGHDFDTEVALLLDIKKHTLIKFLLGKKLELRTYRKIINLSSLYAGMTLRTKPGMEKYILRKSFLPSVLKMVEDFANRHNLTINAVEKLLHRNFRDLYCKNPTNRSFFWYCKLMEDIEEYEKQHSTGITGGDTC